MVKNIFSIILAIALAGCNTLDLKGVFVPTGEGVEKRFEQSREMNQGLKAETIYAECGYSFYVAADPHINETSRSLGKFNDELKNDAEALFGVILGDCTDVKDNLPRYFNALEFSPYRHSFNQKIFHVLGNHDVFFNGWVDFRESAGASVYWFEVVTPDGTDLYISLDTATGTLGRKQTEWFQTFLAGSRSTYRHCVVLTHTNFFYTDISQDSSGNLPLEEIFFLIDFLGKQNVSLVLQGHDHYRDDNIYNNVRYTVLGSVSDLMETPEYLKVDVSENGLELQWHIL